MKFKLKPTLTLLALVASGCREALDGPPDTSRSDTDGGPESDSPIPSDIDAALVVMLDPDQAREDLLSREFP